MATRLAKTGHENRLTESLPQYGLSSDIPMSYVDVGLKSGHPVLRIEDFVQTLNANDKMDMLLMGNRAPVFKEFWDNWEKLQPLHPIYTHHQNRTGQCIPISIHFDEGTTLKKKAIMIIQTQAVIGKGTRKRKSTATVPGCNFIGSTFTTRYLWSVMLARVYSQKAKSKKKSKTNRNPLQELVTHLSCELNDAFFSGMQVSIDGKLQTIYLVPLAVKGDWPALAKVGQFDRHFGRLTYDLNKGKGICHLCQADQVGFKDWSDVSFTNMKSMHQGATLPWAEDPDIVLAIPLPNAYKPSFFQPDLFHSLHKGVFGDIAANTIVFQLH